MNNNSKSLKFNIFLAMITTIFSANSALAQSCQIRQHTKIPNIYGLGYDKARKNLIAAGWQPKKNPWTYKAQLEWDILIGLADVIFQTNIFM